MSDLKPRYFVEKGGRFYWQPSAKLIGAGWRAPPPLSRERAVALRQAEELNRQLDAWRERQKTPVSSRNGTVPWLIERYLASPEFDRIRDRTKRDYRCNFARLAKWSASLGDPPVNAIRKLQVEAFWNVRKHTPSCPENPRQTAPFQRHVTSMSSGPS
jgi:hypothetical protein